MWDYDGVVLDLILPVRDGIEVCRSLRERGSWVPILMLTARAGVGDRIAGLDAGADDCLIKPFDFDELLARVRALVRRTPQERPTRVQIGDLVVDPATRQVVRGDAIVELAATNPAWVNRVGSAQEAGLLALPPHPAASAAPLQRPRQRRCE